MKRLLLVWAVWLLIAPALQAQKYHVTGGFIKFYSEELLEDIEAVKKQAKGLLDSASGQLAFVVPIEGFVFEKALMQEHFNEKYMESDKYPQATFSGHIVDYQAGESGKVWADGDMTIHGVKRHIKVAGAIRFADDKVLINSVFMVKLADYGIEVPELMFQKIAEEVEVTVSLTLKQAQK